VAPGTVTVSADASDSDGSVARVDFFAGPIPIGSATSAPYSITWAGIPAGNYQLRAEAVDNASAVGVSPTRTLVVSDLAELSVSPANPREGQLATVTVAGSPSCGAVELNYGDGTVITYALSGLPTSRTHIWASSGSKTVIATGQGNCVGTATTTVAVAGNAHPVVSLTAPPAGAVFVDPATVTLTADAQDADGAIVRVEFYDGATLIGSSVAPPFTIAWSPQPGSHSVSAKAYDDSNAMTASAVRAISVVHLAGVTLNPATVVQGQPTTITVSGSNGCGAVQIDYGDTTVITYPLSGLPFTQTHTYGTVGAKSITASGQGNCLGQAAATLTVNTNPPPAVTLTAPSNGTVYTAPATITLTASASDAQGISRVEFYSGATLLGAATAAPYTFSWSGVGLGTYSLTARAYDGYGIANTSGAASITVAPPQVTSVSVAPASPRQGQVATVTVNGGSSCGAVTVDYGDATVITYPLSTLPSSFTHAWTTSGTRTVTASGQGNCGGTVSTAVTVPVNTAPMVGLTAPAHGAVFVYPVTVTLSASAQDSDGAIGRVEFYDGASLIGASTTSPYTMSWSPSPGGHIVTAKAYDDSGAVTTSAARSISVVHIAAVTLSPATVVQGQPTTVTVTGSSACGAVQIDYGDGAVITYALSGLPFSQQHAYVTAGPKTITASGQGNCVGLVSAALSVVTNPPPAVTLTSPPNGAFYTAPAGIAMSATATDSHGISRVEFYAGATLVGTSIAAPYNFTWSGVGVGTYSLTARAYDGYGIAATSSAVAVTVAPPQVTSVSVSAPQTQYAAATVAVNGTNPCGAVTLNYGDGTVITYAISALPLSVSHVWTTGGVKVVTATGQGNCGGQVSTVIVVNSLPSVSIATPVNGNNYLAPAALTITSSASDPDGWVVRVDYFINGGYAGGSTTAPYSLPFTNVPAGTYDLLALVTDNSGAQAWSPPVRFTASAAGPSMVTSLTVSNPSPVVGEAVTLTVLGTNPCGAVMLDYGDGTVIFWPIVGVPYSQTYVWGSPGPKTIVAAGMGNCSGQTSTTVIVR